MDMYDFSEIYDQNKDIFYSKASFNIFILKLVSGVGNKTIEKLSKEVNFFENLNLNEIVIKYFNSLQKESYYAIKHNLYDLLNYYADKLKFGIKVISFLDDIYPKGLFSLDDKPVLLFMKGKSFNQIYNYDLSLSIVGTRKYTKYGEEYCRKFVKELSNYNFCIVSGLAYGIDGIAHDEAFKNNMNCIGVLGNGFDYIYPSSNKYLYDKFIENNGVLLTEYFPDQKPEKSLFPRRNRIIAALSKGTLIIEADMDSGSLITANIAFDINRLVFALPADLHRRSSQGCNYLISKNIAKLVMNADDILYEYGILSNKIKSEFYDIKNIQTTINLDGLNEIQKNIIQFLINNELSADELSEISGIAIIDILNALTDLEIKKIIVKNDNEKWLLVK